MIYFLFSLVILLLIFDVALIWWNIYTKIIQPGAIYYPSKDETVERMMRLAKVGPKDVVVDLGSGDGKILIAAAKRGARAIGYEINPLLVRQSRKLVKELGLEKKIDIYRKSFWQADFSKTTVITVYLFPHLMDKLQKVLEKKIRKQIRLVANDYAFPRLKEVKRDKKTYLYYFGK